MRMLKAAVCRRQITDIHETEIKVRLRGYEIAPDLIFYRDAFYAVVADRTDPRQDREVLYQKVAAVEFFEDDVEVRL